MPCLLLSYILVLFLFKLGAHAHEMLRHESHKAQTVSVTGYDSWEAAQIHYLFVSVLGLFLVVIDLTVIEDGESDFFAPGVYYREKGVIDNVIVLKEDDIVIDAQMQGLSVIEGKDDRSGSHFVQKVVVKKNHVLGETIWAYRRSDKSVVF